MLCSYLIPSCFLLPWLLQALAGLNSWPMTGMRTLIWVQLASVAMMVPRLGPLCQVPFKECIPAPHCKAAQAWIAMACRRLL